MLAGFAAMLLAGCNADEYVSAQDSPDALNQYKVHDKYPGKPQAPVDIEFRVSGPYQLNEETEVTVVFTSRKSADDLKVAINARDEQMLISGAQRQYSFGVQQAGQSNEIVLGVTPRAEGMFYISVNARLIVDGVATNRSFAIPVNTAPQNIKKQLKPAGVIQKDSSGERVIIMPAVEPAN